MRGLGIIQREDPLLRRVAPSFSLPADADLAHLIVNTLLNRAAQVRGVHEFSKGMGLAAPQLGLSRRVAIVQLAGAEAPIVLLNARAVASSTETDEPRYEGCLSFFDVRGRLRRPLAIEVEHQDFDGGWHRTTHTGSAARLVAHEIDHLDGVFYTDRMPADEHPIPVREYRDTGKRWRY